MSTLALSMIVRDAEATLASCLESVRAAVDEIVIGDTGSSDSTPAIAARYGARFYSIPWENDFARARNLVLEQVRADWVLALDADEVLDEEGACHLRSHLDNPAIAGYIVPIWNYVWRTTDYLWDQPAQPNPGRLEAARRYPAYVEHENVRLFRRHPQIRFVGRIHETVGTCIQRAGWKLGRAAFIIHHFGLAATPEQQLEKHLRYLELSRLKAREMPGNAQAQFELGVELFKQPLRTQEALACFERARELDARLSPAWVFSALALMRLHRDAEALACLKRAGGSSGSSALVAQTEGDAHYNLGDFETACRAYSRALACPESTAEVESKLGLAEVRAGRTESGLGHLRRALEREPVASAHYDRLISALVWLNRLAEAAEVAEDKLKAIDPPPEAFLRAASLRARCGDWTRAIELLGTGLRRFPQAARLQQALSELQAAEGCKKAGALGNEYQSTMTKAPDD
jgi:tetratricopeptide (TPR) repeat protein